MALITVASDVSPDMNSLTHSPYVSGLFAGETLPVASPCYIKATDGLVYNSGSHICAIANTPDYAGFTVDAVVTGGPVTLFKMGARFNYASSMTSGCVLWISGSPAGKLSDAKLASADTPVAMAVSSTDIVVIR